MNPRLDLLQPYPFERWRALIGGASPSSTLTPIALSIGEPRHPTPPFIQHALSAHLDELAHYPQTLGKPALRNALARWLENRFHLTSIDPDREVLPTLGSREALFSITQVLLDPCAQSLAVCPNPFYQIYEGATLLAGGQPYFINADPAQNHWIDYSQVPAAIWSKTRLVFVCSPANPTGRVMTLDEWKELFDLSDRYGFTLVSDECYSEIYPDESFPPLGGLEAAQLLGRTGWPRLLVMGSLSKRSNVPGLRSAFVAGDRDLIRRFTLYRTYHGSAMSPSVQAASEVAWKDENHVHENRRLYREKMAIFYSLVHPHLPLVHPQAGFYYWVSVPGNDTEFARALYLNHQVAVLPGSFLAREVRGFNPGAGQVRIALVGSHAETVDAAHRVIDFVRHL
ncbi:MAG: succinyldiaminopimelate transaminase [Ferrovum sp.]|nr:succinyldiaminopimelate transaminase [Ferrovum sp.]NDU86947.1 succinyldiaminopimelate transaminase [Ferrovum sp.]